MSAEAPLHLVLCWHMHQRYLDSHSIPLRCLLSLPSIVKIGWPGEIASRR